MRSLCKSLTFTSVFAHANRYGRAHRSQDVDFGGLWGLPGQTSAESFCLLEASGTQMGTTLMILKGLGGHLVDFGGPRGVPGGTSWGSRCRKQDSFGVDFL